jgi:Asp-tRNA(Asn)/Glu-tRNA(Gln) amidotransferase A subunit family amidase
MSTEPPVPDGLLEAFWAYERALVADDLQAMAQLFAPGDDALRGDASGLLVGHDEITEFRRVRGGAPARRIADVLVRVITPEAALVVAVTAPASGGRGLQTQLWRRDDGRWLVQAAHVSAPPVTFDRSVWRAVGAPLLEPTGRGQLDGETVAVKDVFAVSGFTMGAGVPTFAAGAQAQTADAAAVSALRAAGAAIRGIAQCDQFAYSLSGDNAHYGTPVNAVVPAALPGGSSSGTATAVALGAASIGLGTDTAGSIRVPASYQGLWGLRTTHGAIDTSGLLALAPDFDTVGLLTRTSGLLLRAASALLLRAASVLSLRAASVLVPDRGSTQPVRAFETLSLDESGIDHDLDHVAEAFRVHQAWQAWQVHGAWITAHPDAVVGSAAERFRIASTVTEDDDRAARTVLSEARAAWDEALGDAVLVLPSAAGPAPRLWASPGDVDAARRATLRLTCVAGVTGRPVVAAPLSETPQGPVGTSFVGPPGSDLELIRWVSSAFVGDVNFDAALER